MDTPAALALDLAFKLAAQNPQHWDRKVILEAAGDFYVFLTEGNLTEPLADQIALDIEDLGCRDLARGQQLDTVEREYVKVQERFTDAEAAIHALEVRLDALDGELHKPVVRGQPLGAGNDSKPKPGPVKAPEQSSSVEF